MSRVRSHTPPGSRTLVGTRSLVGSRGLAVVATLVIAVIASCSSSGSDESASDAAQTTSTTEAIALEGLVGRYAHYDEVAYEDDTMKTVIISSGFSDLELRDGELWNVQEFCHADVASDQGIEVTIADAATRAIIPIATPVEVSEVDGQLQVVRPATPTPIGIEMDDPAAESLPTDPNDPRIFDADGDGNPGITSSIKVGDGLQGDVYLARREIFTYDLVQVDPDRFEGTITDESEQLVLGASNPVFLATAQWEQIDDPARNIVIWQRVEDDWDCDRLAQERDGLFPPKPLADW